jgi:pimeloyl-ACP methyl ester carboxylesterase
MFNRSAVFATTLCAAVLVSTPHLQGQKPQVKNIVLVHGAWADGSGWRGVYDNLIKDGFTVSIVQEPETSFQDDVTAVKRILALQHGPSILVAHSYGGSVVTEAGTDPSVAGLVYVAAHMPDAGESESEDGKLFPSDLSKSTAMKTTPDGFTYLDPAQLPYYFAAGLVYVAAHMPDAGESESEDGKLFPSDLSKSTAMKTTPDGFTYLDPAQLPYYFAADLPPQQAAFMARSQVFNAAVNFQAVITTAAWRDKPSWMVVAGADRTINPDLERFYAKRANSHTTEVPGASHCVFISHPKEVADVIESAARTVSN